MREIHIYHKGNGFCDVYNLTSQSYCGMLEDVGDTDSVLNVIKNVLRSLDVNDVSLTEHDSSKEITRVVMIQP